jgi:hypothetical protein
MMFVGIVVGTSISGSKISIAPTSIQAALLSGQSLALPPNEWRKVEENLARNPFRTDLLTLLFVQSVADGNSRHDSGSLAGYLQRFGRRSTPAQLALVVEAAKRDDLPGVMEQIDSLLRRERQTELLFDFLQQIEMVPEGRAELVRALASAPSWAKWYLSRPQDIANKRVVDARAALLTDLRKSGSVRDRDHLAASINALHAAQRSEEAFEAWSYLEKESAKSILADPDFKLLQRYSPDQSYLLTAFDWQLHSGNGFYSSINAGPTEPTVRIDWNGSGVPLFLSQTLKQLEQRPIILTLQSSNSPIQLARSLAIAARCPGKNDIRFVMEPRNDTRAVYYRSEETIRCAFPQLRISGKLMTSASPVELSLTSISIANSSIRAVSRDIAERNGETGSKASLERNGAR